MIKFRKLKGQAGADCLLVVNTETGFNCGSIYFEAKRTKGIFKSWIKKLKKDSQNKNSDISILVTETMPNNKDGHLVDGIWVTHFSDFLKITRNFKIWINKYSKSKKC